MAVAAETITGYLAVDEIAGVAEAREAERAAAWELLEGRREERQAAGEGLAPPVDALSTADGVLEAARVFGSGSAEHRERFDGLVLDCQRLVAEWFRKKKPEYFPAVRHVYDAETEEFFSHGFSIAQMTRNALLPVADNPEEEARRVNERVEDATPQILRGLGSVALGGVVGGDVAIRTISECTDKAIADYTADVASGAEHRGYDGYVPEIQKLMVRDIRLREDTDDRFEEQVGLPGIYITHEVVQMALARCGVETADDLDKTGLHGSQLLVRDDLLDFVSVLDEVASEQWCTNIFMGEEVPADFMKNYGGFREEALARQEGLKEQSQTVANFVLDLAADGVDRRAALGLVEDFVKKLLLNLAKNDYAMAEQMFDEKTALGLREVARLESIGADDEAFRLMRDVERDAPGGGFCGGGSCGLESVNTKSSEGQSLARKLRATAGDTIVRDKVRACKCGSKSVAYAYSATKVKKLCESCGSYESKSSVVKEG